MKDDSVLDNMKELISGGWIMLFIFGLTICLLASLSLIMAVFVHDPVKVTMLSKVLDTVLGFIAGAYTTMWNNQHFKAEKKNGENGGDNAKEKPVETVVTADPNKPV